MTRYCSAVLAFGLLAGIASAQDAPARPALQGTRQLTQDVRAFYKTLHLTPEQEAKRKTINDKYRPKLVAVLEKYRKDRDAYSSSKKTKADLAKHKQVLKKITSESAPLRAQYQKELDSVYTQEQRTKLKTFAEQMKKRAATAPRKT